MLDEIDLMMGKTINCSQKKENIKIAQGNLAEGEILGFLILENSNTTQEFEKNFNFFENIKNCKDPQ